MRRKREREKNGAAENVLVSGRIVDVVVASEVEVVLVRPGIATGSMPVSSPSFSFEDERY